MLSPCFIEVSSIGTIVRMIVGIVNNLSYVCVCMYACVCVCAYYLAKD